MKHTLYYLTLTLFIFQGCSTNDTMVFFKDYHILPTDEKEEAKIEDCDPCDEDTSEFDDEFEDEEKEEPIDPLSGYNKTVTSFNDGMIIYALNPISEAYAFILPEPLRVGVSNVIHNLKFPVRFANNLLQGKFQNSSDELERFIVNSTVGIAGLMDPAATYMHIPKHNEDFGQTLGHYGVGPGFHVVLPFLGPSNVRDIVGLTLDGYASPLVNVRGLENYKIPDNFSQSVSIAAVRIVNYNSLHLGEYESLKQDALELYPFLRDVYEQKRVSEIKE